MDITTLWAHAKLRGLLLRAVACNWLADDEGRSQGAEPAPERTTPPPVADDEDCEPLL